MDRRGKIEMEVRDIGKPAAKVQLRKEMGLLHCVAIMVGVVIGAGIFVSPVGILIHVKSVGMSCVMWVVCGAFSTLCALCFAELGSAIPHSGGEYTYIRRAFGDFPSFLCMWINFILVCPGALAIASLVFALYVLRPAFPDCPPPDAALRLLAWVATAMIVAVNCLDTRWATKTQVAITISKLLAVFFVIALGIYAVATGSTENFERAFVDSDTSPGSLVLAFYAGYWSYGGWNYLVYMTDEVIHPHRNVPIALVLSLTAVTLVYLVTNLAYFAVLTPALMVQSSAVAVTFVQYIVPPMAYVMPIFIALSVFGNMNGTCLTFSRLFFVAAQNSHLPKLISLIRVKGSTPVASLISMMVLTGGMLIYTDVFQLMEMMGFSFCLNLNMTLLGLVYLRWAEPALPRPVKVPIFLPVLLVLGVAGLQGMTVYQKPRESGVALLLMALSLPFYFLGVVWDKPKNFNRRFAQLTQSIQKILMAVPAEIDETSGM